MLWEFSVLLGGFASPENIRTILLDVKGCRLCRVDLRIMTIDASRSGNRFPTACRNKQAQTHDKSSNFRWKVTHASAYSEFQNLEHGPRMISATISQCDSAGHQGYNAQTLLLLPYLSSGPTASVEMLFDRQDGTYLANIDHPTRRRSDEGTWHVHV